MSGWRPIETAPKDGSAFIAWDSVHGCPVFDMRIDEDGELCADATLWSGHASHWMPRPTKPEPTHD